MVLTLASGIDGASLAAEYAATGRIQVRNLIAGGGVDTLYQRVRARTDWRQLVNSGDKVFELDRQARAAMSQEQAAQLDAAVHAGARAGFQYRFETIRIDDRIRDPFDPLDAFAAFLSTGPARDLLRTITSRPEIAFADAQATAYAPGDFLTGHDDEVAGKGRVAAYVFSLTPVWRVEWGGLLLFHGADGRVQGFAPQFGTLNLFAVPQLHSVSMVTPAAPGRRYSVTGWLRTG